MVKPKAIDCPTICYRPIEPSDREVLEQIHGNLFPIRYESEFFQNVVNGRDIVSWAAVAHSRPDGRSDELIGFVTARTVMAKDSEISDLLRHDSLTTDQTLVYILTLGVVETYRNLGIASSLVQKVIKYASSIPTCRAAYLHVISYNSPAIKFYKKMSFKCLQRLPGFYFINGQHYDSYLFIYYVNGGRSPCSLLEVVTFMVSYLRDGIKSVASRLRKNEKRKISKWPKCKESHSLISMAQSKRNVAVESSGYECV
ncbi:histone acetyltransferase MCC1 [Momordica charantia]|uniref:N-alpha-acetyltransferase 60 n=1 Tax=Momordica charantia TaxID=3673 RepID=A0A6J1D4H1_MOMCH|nr:histone acetyltransferase MCC1 [Momordica charantia]XP_022148605.1 histone acetyltransferase MCC1 [Momordica charantia]